MIEEKMETFPIMLNLRGRRVVVVGAGPIAQRKAAALAEAGAAVVLVAPDASAAEPGVEVVAATYDPSVIGEAVLVFACTDDAALNRRIVEDARRAGALANAVDQPDACDFFSAAVVRDGDVVVAIGTGGAAPGLASVLREAVADAMPPRIGEFAAALHHLRDQLKARQLDADRRRQILTDLASQDSYQAFLADGPAALQDRMEDLLS